MSFKTVPCKPMFKSTYGSDGSTLNSDGSSLNSNGSSLNSNGTSLKSDGDGSWHNLEITQLWIILM